MDNLDRFHEWLKKHFEDFASLFSTPEQLEGVLESGFRRVMDILTSSPHVKENEQVTFFFSRYAYLRYRRQHLTAHVVYDFIMECKTLADLISYWEREATQPKDSHPETPT